MARYRNCCWTLNNPEEATVFDDDTMQYLVYQEEIGESGTYHFQGYCEFLTALCLNTVKRLLGGDGVHVERRRGTQDQAIDYCKREFNEDGTPKRIPGTDVFEEGERRQQGKRVDLESFKNEVAEGARKRDLIADHFKVIAMYPRFYNELTMLNRPKREAVTVSLLYGETGTGKTRFVHERFGSDEDFYNAPLNNGTMWYDAYDGHKVVLLDDFAGAASHISLCALLRLLDRYPVLVPTKGSHTWWSPGEIYITTNVLPRNWYKWENRGEQYKALARRFHAVIIYNRHGVDSLSRLGREGWWELNAPIEAVYQQPLLNPMTGLPLICQ